MKAQHFQSLAVVKNNGQWWIVRRTIHDSDGEPHDTPLEGPFAGEGAAECRASAIVVAEGDARREERRRYQLKGRKGRQKPVDKQTMNQMVKFLMRATHGDER